MRGLEGGGKGVGPYVFLLLWERRGVGLCMDSRVARYVFFIYFFSSVIFISPEHY